MNAVTQDSQNAMQVSQFDQGEMPVVATSSAALILDSASMDSMMRLADIMAKGRATVPEHLRGNAERHAAEAKAAAERQAAAVQAERERDAAAAKAQMEQQAADAAQAAQESAFAATPQGIARDQFAALADHGRLADLDVAYIPAVCLPVQIEVIEAAPYSPPTLRLGQISDRLGFTVTATFMESLGFAPAATDKAAKLYHEGDFKSMCPAICRHISAVQAKHAI